jgi:hypothetical protein
MKPSNILRVVLVVMCYSSLLAQEEPPKKINRISITDFYFQPGLFSQANTISELSEFKTLAPQSTLLKGNLSDYNQSGGFNYSVNSILTVMLGFKFSDKQKTRYKPNPLLRLGISYFSGTSLTGGLYKETRKPYDTLISAQTGQITYIDSVIKRTIGMYYISQQLRLDGSFIYRTNPEARWSLFAGIGITAGLSINANTTIYYNKYDILQTRSSNDNLNSTNAYSNSNNGKTESFRNKTNLGFSAYIPAGVDFRIGKKREFWKRTHLYYELRPGINTTFIPELRTTTGGSFQQGIGLRVSWN